MEVEHATTAPVHKKRPKTVEGESPAAAGEAPEAKRPKADAAGDAAVEKPPRKKPGPKPGFKRKPKIDSGAPVSQGDAAGGESAPASQSDAPASPPHQKPVVAHTETAAPEATAGKAANKVPLQLRVIVESLNVRFLVRVSKALTVHTVRNRIEAHYARLYPEIASHDGGALEVHKLLDSERFELDDRDPIGAVVSEGGVVYVQTLASYQAQVAARLKALPAGSSSAGKAATPKKPKAASTGGPAPKAPAPAAVPAAARPAAASDDEDDDDDDNEGTAAGPALKAGGTSKVASVPPPKPARKGDVASFESPTGSPATKTGARPAVGAKAAPVAAKRLPVTAATAEEEEDDEDDEDEDEAAAPAPKVPVSTVIPPTKAFGAGAKGFPTAGAKAAAAAAALAESDEDDSDSDDDDLPAPSKTAKPAKTGAGLQALARDGAKVNAATAPTKAGTAVVAAPGKASSAKAGKTPAAPAKPAASKPAKAAPAAASDDEDDDSD